jgi:hypothetical protein
MTTKIKSNRFDNPMTADTSRIDVSSSPTKTRGWGCLWRTALLGLSGISAGIFGASSVEARQPFHPFAESMDMDPDYQLFAPVDLQELDELSARKRANRGWFVAYDRLHIGFDRPDVNGLSSKIDMTWGNRWDFGFMADSDRGWLFNFTHVSGPNVYNDIRKIRSVLPTTGTTLTNINGIGQFSADTPRFPFDPNFGDGTIIERQSVNVGTLSSFEANKTWRREPYRFGGILEPMVGFRYMQFNDYAINDNFNQINTDADAAFEIDQFTRSTTRTENRMILGQLGYRYTSSLRRMTFSHDGRFFGGQNFQTQGFESRSFNYTPGNDDGQPVTNPSASFGRTDNNEFVVGMDLRMEAAMQLTKAFNIRAGTQVLYIGRGIWRGANPGLGNQGLFDQSLISPAFTFGATFNR